MRFQLAMFPPRNREGYGSEQISLGASDSKKPPTDDVERFLSMLCFDSKGKLRDVGIEIDHLLPSKRGKEFESCF
jgi:hypothetical protein